MVFFPSVNLDEVYDVEIITHFPICGSRQIRCQMLIQLPIAKFPTIKQGSLPPLFCQGKISQMTMLLAEIFSRWKAFDE
jgi:hypothetical protein